MTSDFRVAPILPSLGQIHSEPYLVLSGRFALATVSTLDNPDLTQSGSVIDEESLATFRRQMGFIQDITWEI